MKIRLHSPMEEVQITIIPLIDVVFCILTFFILAALQFTHQQSINVDLPKANTGTTPQMRQMLVVSLDPSGQTYVEQKPVTRDQLYQVLQSYHLSTPTGLMVLNASREVSYNQVIQVLDLLRQVGGDRAALATLPSSNKPASSSVGILNSSTPSPSTGSGQLNPYRSLNPPIPSISSPTTPRQQSAEPK